MVVVDLEGDARSTPTPGSTEISGYSAEDRRDAEDARRGAVPRTAPRLRMLRDAFAPAEYPSKFDLRVRRRDGEVHTLSLSTSAALRDENAVIITCATSPPSAPPPRRARAHAALPHLAHRELAGRHRGRLAHRRRAAAQLRRRAHPRVVAAPTSAADAVIDASSARGTSRSTRGGCTAASRGASRAPAARSSRATARSSRCCSPQALVRRGPRAGMVVIFSDQRERLRIEERLARGAVRARAHRAAVDDRGALRGGGARAQPAAHEPSTATPSSSSGARAKTPR
jgi:hypothetical protein